MVLDGLAREPIVALSLQVSGDEALVDSVERTVAEERLEMAAQVSAVVLDRGALALHHMLEVVDVLLPRLDDGPSLPAGHDHGVRVDAPAQLALGLHVAEPFAATGLALEADPAVRLSAAWPLPAPIPALAPAVVARDVERARAVGALGHRAIVARGRFWAPAPLPRLVLSEMRRTARG